MTKQAIIYCRFSPRPNAKECDSSKKQHTRCLAYCDQRNYNLIAWFSDEAKSGGTLDRPQLQTAIELLKPGGVLVVDSSDRLARDMLVNLTIRYQVEQAGATIEYANGSPAGTTPEGKLLENILAAFAAYERDRICLKTKQGLARKRKNGEKSGGYVPIGWKKDPEDPKRLVRFSYERRAIVLICTLHAETDMPSTRIAEELTEGHGLCRDKPWSARTVRKIIKREAYWADPIDGDLSLEPMHP